MAEEKTDKTSKKVPNIRTVRRLAADLLKCGKAAVWISPDLLKPESAPKIGRSYVRSKIRNDLIIKRSIHGQSRLRCRERSKAKTAGRHTGIGKRSGTANARRSTKSSWIFRIRVLRRLLRNYRREGKIDKKLHHSLYLKSKGNAFKNKRVLVDCIHKTKSESIRLKAISDQIEALREKNRATRKRRSSRKVE